jgi:serine/threonine protein kinase
VNAPTGPLNGPGANSGPRRPLADDLEQLGLLTPTQLRHIRDVLRIKFPHDYDLAMELERLGWLSSYQVSQIGLGKAGALSVGPYQILDLLGEGGFGQVFLARHSYLQRLVALKLLRSELASDAEAVDQFYREVGSLGQLSHPNLILAHEAGPIADTHFLAMEYLVGVNLQTMVDDSGPLEADQACDYIRQAALGLQHMYDSGLVHRDIKPSNLMVKPTDDPGETTRGARGTWMAAAAGQSFPWGMIKILDLGLARSLQTGGDLLADNPMPNRESGLRGSADYLAPEQAIDFQSADIRADIYSLGCTFYYLVTGRPPFEGPLALKLMKHQREEPAAVEQLRGGLPRKLGAVIRKMMAKLPSDRFRTPAEAAAAIAGTTRQNWLSLGG